MMKRKNPEGINLVRKSRKSYLSADVLDFDILQQDLILHYQQQKDMTYAPKYSESDIATTYMDNMQNKTVSILRMWRIKFCIN
jgi:hypothetical protein